MSASRMPARVARPEGARWQTAGMEAGLRVHGGGSGEPVLVLIHGLGATGDVWDGWWPLLARRWPGRWLAPDLPGHGGSRPLSGYTFDNLADAVASIVEPDARTVVLGHSLGGVAGLALASGRFAVSVQAVIGLGIKVVWTDEDLDRARAAAHRSPAWFASRDEAAARYLRLSGLAGLLPVDDPAVNAGLREQDGRWRVASGQQGVVPFPVEGVSPDRALFQGLHLLVGDLDALLVGAGVQSGLDGQPGRGGGRGDRLNNDFVAGQRPAAPVHGDLGEQTVLNPVPFRGSRREVAHADLQAEFFREPGQLHLPQPQPAAVGTASIGGDQQPGGVRVDGLADLLPPAADRLHRERPGIGVGADVHPAGGGRHVIDPVGDGPAQLALDVMHSPPLGLTARPPRLPAVLIVADQLRFLVSALITGCPAAWNSRTCSLMNRNCPSRSGCCFPSTVLALPCRL